MQRKAVQHHCTMCECTLCLLQVAQRLKVHSLSGLPIDSNQVVPQSELRQAEIASV